jgi:hypothetical protein
MWAQQITVVQHAEVSKPCRDGVDAQYMGFALFHDLNGAEKIQQFVREITGHGGVVLIEKVSFARLN